MMPVNPTSFTVDVVGALFAPRLLIADWLYEGGYHPLLVAIFVVLQILAMIPEAKTTSAMSRR